jgi:hypothetical protein
MVPPGQKSAPTRGELGPPGGYRGGVHHHDLKIHQPAVPVCSLVYSADFETGVLVGRTL